MTADDLQVVVSATPGSIAMLLEGSIWHGAIVLDAPAELPNGTRVRIEPVPAPSPPPASTTGRVPIASLQAIKEQLQRERENPPPAGPTMAERMKDFLGHEVDLPADAASRVDHYLEHGVPRAESGT
jgi:hypothetical protein